MNGARIRRYPRVSPPWRGISNGKNRETGSENICLDRITSEIPHTTMPHQRNDNSEKCCAPRVITQVWLNYSRCKTKSTLSLMFSRLLGRI